jgi:prevent-host-death family protein
MTELSIAEARDQFSEAINRAAYGKERIFVTRRGRRLAVIVPVEDIEALEAIEDRIDLEEAAKARAEAKENGTISLAEMKAKYGL